MNELDGVASSSNTWDQFRWKASEEVCPLLGASKIPTGTLGAGAQLCMLNEFASIRMKHFVTEFTDTLRTGSKLTGESTLGGLGTLGASVARWAWTGVVVEGRVATAWSSELVRMVAKLVRASRRGLSSWVSKGAVVGA